MKNGRPLRPEGGDGELVQPAGALAAAEDEQRRTVGREPEAATCFSPLDRARPGRNRAPCDTVFPILSTFDREGEKDPLRKRRREPVREAEMRVRLEQRRRNAASSRRGHDRATDI